MPLDEGVQAFRRHWACPGGQKNVEGSLRHHVVRQRKTPGASRRFPSRAPPYCLAGSAAFGAEAASALVSDVAAAFAAFLWW